MLRWRERKKRTKMNEIKEKRGQIITKKSFFRCRIKSFSFAVMYRRPKTANSHAQKATGGIVFVYLVFQRIYTLYTVWCTRNRGAAEQRRTFYSNFSCRLKTKQRAHTVPGARRGGAALNFAVSRPISSRLFFFTYALLCPGSTTQYILQSSSSFSLPWPWEREIRIGISRAPVTR